MTKIPVTHEDFETLLKDRYLELKVPSKVIDKKKNEEFYVLDNDTKELTRIEIKTIEVMNFYTYYIEIEPWRDYA